MIRNVDIVNRLCRKTLAGGVSYDLSVYPYTGVYRYNLGTHPEDLSPGISIAYDALG